jgi:hypothetical protein
MEGKSFIKFVPGNTLKICLQPLADMINHFMHNFKYGQDNNIFLFVILYWMDLNP